MCAAHAARAYAWVCLPEPGGAPTDDARPPQGEMLHFVRCVRGFAALCGVFLSFDSFRGCLVEGETPWVGFEGG